jgi:xanthosine utilization system XapX-like protein
VLPVVASLAIRSLAPPHGLVQGLSGSQNSQYPPAIELMGVIGARIGSSKVFLVARIPNTHQPLSSGCERCKNWLTQDL